MKRDSHSISIWQNNTPEMPILSETGNDYYDAIIVGAGITGISTAYQLQNSGLKCLVIERQEIGSGTTGGTTAHINSLLDFSYKDLIKKFGLDRAKMVAKATMEAKRIFAAQIRDLKIACDYRECTGYLFAATKEQSRKLLPIAFAAKAVGLPLSFTKQLPIQLEYDSAVRVAREASIHPTAYIQGVAAAFVENGGRIVEHCSYLSHTSKNDQQIVRSGKGNYRCAHLIFATHLPPGKQLIQLKCMPYRSYVVALQTGKPLPEDALLYDMNDPFHYIRTQYIDGTPYVLVGGGDHRTGTNGDSGDPYRSVEQFSKRLFPDMKIRWRWSSQFYESVDGLPFIGKLPGAGDNVYVATGYGGNGIMYSQLAASIIHDLILLRPNEWARLFDPKRLRLFAEFGTYLHQLKSFAKGWLCKLKSRSNLSGGSSLAPGEGGIYSSSGKKLAVARSANGRLIAFESACRHQGCQVSWNRAEQSWDCSCHGARYDFEGRVLNGPAVHSLKEVELEKDNTRSIT
jgi:glycine/D-amino acid oxidase-like deaminating enzyme/nitrite reductase/ring-hydroxylating ferredoxin subunit